MLCITRGQLKCPKNIIKKAESNLFSWPKTNNRVWYMYKLDNCPQWINSYQAEKKCIYLNMEFIQASLLQLQQGIAMAMFF